MQYIFILLSGKNCINLRSRLTRVPFTMPMVSVFPTIYGVFIIITVIVVITIIFIVVITIIIFKSKLNFFELIKL